MVFKNISSPNNPLVKEIVALSEKSKLRRETSTCVVEGLREVSLAIKGGYKLKTLIFNPSTAKFEMIIASCGPEVLEVELIEVTDIVYSKMAYREGTQGVIGVFHTKNLSLEDLIYLHDNPLILVAEAPEKPGNIGAILRTADAAGVDAILIANPKTDIYNPNIIRSSVGCVFTNQIVCGSTEEIISYLVKKGIKIYCATIANDSKSYFEQDFTGPSCIVLGTEDTGLSDTWIGSADVNICIPMAGRIDSINVSVSAGILIFEAVRQRLVPQNFDQ
jgi:TrmH family RNA methyltransferase